MQLIARIMSDILRGVAFLHGKFLLHRDLKPANILLDSKNKAKICDFSLGRKMTFGKRRKSTQIQSLWYRAPEIMQENHEFYGTEVDMWAIGAIFA